MSEEPSRIHYLNTDLDLICAHDLTPLTIALDARGTFTLDVHKGDDGNWYSRHEIADDVEPDEPEATIRVMLDAIESLGGEAKELWDACATRELNIGYDCGDEPWAFNQGLTNSTLKRMASVGASFRITLYPYRQPQASPNSLMLDE